MRRVRTTPCHRPTIIEHSIAMKLTWWRSLDHHSVLFGCARWTVRSSRLFSSFCCEYYFQVDILFFVLLYLNYQLTTIESGIVRFSMVFCHPHVRSKRMKNHRHEFIAPALTIELYLFISVRFSDVYRYEHLVDLGRYSRCFPFGQGCFRTSF